MPIVLKKNELFIKDKVRDEFRPTNVIAEQTSAQVIEEIEAAETAAETAMENKAAETIASIPDDYTQLAGDVDDLKKDYENIPNQIQHITGSTYGTWQSGYYNTPAVGSAVSLNIGSDWVTTLIPVSKGDVIYFNGTGGGGTSRLYVFIDTNGNALNRCDINMIGAYYAVADYDNVAYIAVNNRIVTQADNYYAYKGKSIENKVKEISGVTRNLFVPGNTSVSSANLTVTNVTNGYALAGDTSTRYFTVLTSETAENYRGVTLYADCDLNNDGAEGVNNGSFRIIIVGSSETQVATVSTKASGHLHISGVVPSDASGKLALRFFSNGSGHTATYTNIMLQTENNDLYIPPNTAVDYIARNAVNTPVWKLGTSVPASSMYANLVRGHIANNKNLEALSHQGYSLSDLTTHTDPNRIPSLYGAYLRGFDTLLVNFKFTLDGVPICNHDDYITIDGSNIVIAEHNYSEFASGGTYEVEGLATLDDAVYIAKMCGMNIMFANMANSTAKFDTINGILKKYQMWDKSAWLSTGPSTHAPWLTQHNCNKKLYCWLRNYLVDDVKDISTSMTAFASEVNTLATSNTDFEFILWFNMDEDTSDIISALQTINPTLQKNVKVGICGLDNSDLYLAFAPYVSHFHSDYTTSGNYVKTVEDAIISKYPIIAQQPYYRNA